MNRGGDRSSSNSQWKKPYPVWASLITVAVLLMIAGFIPDRAVPDKTQAKKQHDRDKQTTQEAQPQRQPPAPRHFVLKDEPTAKQTQKQGRHEYGQWWNVVWQDIKWTDATVAIFTVVLSYVAWLQIRDTRINQRAYLSVEPSGIGPFISSNASYLSDVLAHIDVRNAGHLPARGVRWGVWIECDERRDREDFPIIAGAFKGNNVLPPGAVMTQGTSTIRPTEFMLFNGARERYCYVWGEVQYDDGLGKKRITKFCHRYNCAIIVTGATSISREHGRYHHHGNDAT